MSSKIDLQMLTTSRRLCAEKIKALLLKKLEKKSCRCIDFPLTTCCHYSLTRGFWPLLLEYCVTLGYYEVFLIFRSMPHCCGTRGHSFRFIEQELCTNVAAKHLRENDCESALYHIIFLHSLRTYNVS